MSHDYLYAALPFLNDIPRERQMDFERYFQSAPLWLLSCLQVEEVRKGVIFIKENEPARMVYLVGRGIVEAIDYRVQGIQYSYMEFRDLYAFGGMEFVMDLDRYKTTLRTKTNCTMVKIEMEKFREWMYSDIRALKYESKLVGEYLLKSARNERVFLMLQGTDRLAMLLINRYEQYQKDGVCQILGGRQNLSDETGMCLRSVSRAVKRFQEDGLLTKEGNRIFISEEQYRLMKEDLESKVIFE